MSVNHLDQILERLENLKSANRMTHVIGKEKLVVVPQSELDQILFHLEKAVRALGKYRHCRHGCIECRCTDDARVSLAEIAKGDSNAN